MGKINQLPSIWETSHLTISDSQPEEAPALQRIDEAVPEVHGWTEVVPEEELKQEMLTAALHGYLPPDGIRACFRLQSIRVKAQPQIIGFLATYQGFPEEDILWITVLAFHPDFQAQGYGPELMNGLYEQARELGNIQRMRLCVSLKNWRGLHFWIQSGFERIILFKGDKALSDKTQAYMILEKTGFTLRAG